MELPPQPTPSAIEVTNEDDPLTLEWEVILGSKRLEFTLSLWTAALSIVLGSTLWFCHSLGGWNWLLRVGQVALLAVGLLLITRIVRRRLSPLSRMTGQARLVLHPDSLIWVGGGGQIPQVYRKSEVIGIEAEPPESPREVFIVVEAENGLHYPLAMQGHFAPRDLPWLAGVLQRWHQGAT